MLARHSWLRLLPSGRHSRPLLLLPCCRLLGLLGLLPCSGLLWLPGSWLLRLLRPCAGLLCAGLLLAPCGSRLLGLWLLRLPLGIRTRGGRVDWCCGGPCLYWRILSDGLRCVALGLRSEEHCQFGNLTCFLPVVAHAFAPYVGLWRDSMLSQVFAGEGSGLFAGAIYDIVCFHRGSGLLFCKISKDAANCKRHL